MALCWSALAIRSSDEFLAAGNADGLSGRISTQPRSARGGIFVNGHSNLRDIVRSVICRSEDVVL